MTTRRDFLKQSALITTGLLLPKTFNINLTVKPKVVIIGSGLAGLAAGYKLTKNGFDVTILEARNRIGGRVFSYQIDKTEKLIVELGGEWVGDSHTRIKVLCQELGLTLQNDQLDTHLIFAGEYFPKGKWDYSAEWKNKYNKIISDYKSFTEDDKKKLDKTDWWRFLMKNGIEERDMQIRELFDSTDFGESIRQVSAYQGLAEYAESDARNEMDYKIKGGNSKLPEKLAEKMGMDNINLKHKVIEITQADGGVSVVCDNGKVFQGDQLICTVPTYALSNINWKPHLPDDYLDALNSLQYARINKQAVLFKERFWKDESFDMVTDTYGHYFYHATKNQKSTKGVLISYTVGDKAEVISGQNDEFKTRMITESLKPAFGDISSKIEKHVNYYWGEDTYSYGSYAIYNKGQWFNVMPALKQKFMSTHFAGEHLADWQGFMEGAVNSGEEAADVIIG
jgi:monoamine oxidase